MRPTRERNASACGTARCANEGRSVGRYNVAKRERAADLQVEVQPLGKGRVQMRDAPVGHHGQKTLRQTVVECEGRLEPAQRLALADALARHIVDLPEREPPAAPPARTGERTHRDVQPACGAAAARTRTHVDVLLARLLPLGGAAEAKVGLRGIRLAGEELLESGRPPCAAPRQPMQGTVAVDRAAVRVDDLNGTVEAVGDGVKTVKPGDRLYTAKTVTGAYAEYALALEEQVRSLPERRVRVQGSGGLGALRHRVPRSPPFGCSTRF